LDSLGFKSKFSFRAIIREVNALFIPQIVHLIKVIVADSSFIKLCVDVRKVWLFSIGKFLIKHFLGWQRNCYFIIGKCLVCMRQLENLTIEDSCWLDEGELATIVQAGFDVDSAVLDALIVILIIAFEHVLSVRVIELHVDKCLCVIIFGSVAKRYLLH